ncbi:MAG: hypothetical protein KKG00_05385 [Bacteroidetes bacterium]|nr:hypothetical protein [Bacteroidota bacterium]
MKFKNTLMMVAITLVTFGCREDDSELRSQMERRTQRDRLIEQEFAGYWNLVRIHSDQPIDVNLDGMASTDLMAEIPYHANVSAQIKLNWAAPVDRRKVFSDGYVRTHPEKEAGGGTDRYSVNGRVLFFDMDESRTQLTLADGEKVQTHRMHVNSRGQLTVEGIERSYHYKGGWIKLTTTSTYERAR